MEERARKAQNKNDKGERRGEDGSNPRTHVRKGKTSLFYHARRRCLSAPPGSLGKGTSGLQTLVNR